MRTVTSFIQCMSWDVHSCGQVDQPSRQADFDEYLKVKASTAIL